jgi:hypothetical protein
MINSKVIDASQPLAKGDVDGRKREQRDAQPQYQHLEHGIFLCCQALSGSGRKIGEPAYKSEGGRPRCV